MDLLSKKERLLFSIKKTFDEHPIIKFSTIAIVIIAYFIFVSQKHGLKEGLLISMLSWSFFVLCTPIADAGILIDFPMRIIAGIQMVYSEIVVWIIAIALNISTFFLSPATYDKTILLSLFKHILEAPFPYWIIIVLSCFGTFASIYIADSLINSKKKEQVTSNILIKYRIVIFLFLFIMVMILYDFLLNKLGVHIPLI
ncbi:hypothetical protein H6503_05440 [Candidatus Woesearchaeota archaeon]|nr:hypothetical protein [Candidatus Woesearchaeota archaeon]